MKTNKSKLRILPLLLALVLMLVSMPTQALAAATNFSAIVKAGGMAVYRDANLKSFWGRLPGNTVVIVRAYRNNVAQISYRGRVGYAAVSAMNAVESVATKAVASRNTRVFQYASTSSRYVNVGKGTAMNIIAVNGSCAMVERAGYVGYAYTGHLAVPGQSNNSFGSSAGNSTQQRFEQAFAQQQAAGTVPSKPAATPAPAPSAPSTGTSTGNSAIEQVFNSGKYSNEQLCYAFLVKVCGYSSAAASGVITNIKYESGFRPGAIGDSGNSMGICQWNSSRKNLLISWCRDNGHDPETLLGQLYFLKYELEVRYPKINTYLKSIENTSQGAYDAAYYFCYNFERPANKANRSAERGVYAKNTMYPRYASVSI